MKPARHKASRKREGAKRAKSLRRKVRFITPAEARRRAGRHLLNRLFKGAMVRDGAEAKLNICMRGGWTGKDVWAVYKNSENPASLKSSEVVLVSKRTGRVLYEGSACDEG